MSADQLPTPPAPSFVAKIGGLAATRAAVAARREQGQTIVWTNGCFDVLHRGHVAYLDAARRLGNVLVVGLNSDVSVARLKGPGRPLVPLAGRLDVVAALASVELVTWFDDDTPAAAIEALRPDVLVKGGDYRPEAVVGGDAVRAWGGRVEIVPFLEGWSTSELLARARRDERA